MTEVVTQTFKSFSSWREFRETFFSLKGQVAWHLSSFCTSFWWICGTFIHEHLGVVSGFLAKVWAAMGPLWLKVKIIAAATWETVVTLAAHT